MTPETKIKNEISMMLFGLKLKGQLDFWWSPTVGVWDAKQGRFRKNNSKYAITGLADITVIPKKGGPCIFIEVKSKKGVQSDNQKKFQERVEKMGHMYILARSAADVRPLLWTYLADARLL